MFCPDYLKPRRVKDETDGISAGNAEDAVLRSL
jgi:hypothetical protein